jgi:hypothetical protein
MYIMVDYNIFVQKLILVIMYFYSNYTPIEIFLTFMKFVILISHVILNSLEHVCEPCEKFDNFYFTNDGLLGC